MKITIVSMEIPYPPNHGGRVDIWRRIMALSHLGVDIQLVCWGYSLPSADDSAVIQKHVVDFYPILYKKDIFALGKRAIDYLKYPLQATSRIVSGAEKNSLFQRVRGFSPDVIMADHVHCGLIAQELSQLLDKPYVVRSHDIEHLHYGYWLKSAQGLSRLKLLLSLWHLKAYEFSILTESQAFYDISTDDLEFWHTQGLKNGRFLAPLIDGLERKDSAEVQDTEEPDLSYDVVFLGNLRTENNVAGVTWFLQEVLPKIVLRKPDVRVLISGSQPVQSLIDLCSKLGNVDLKANPVSARKIYQSGRVLINPISQGSGTSIKSVDMLTLDRAIVTLKKGVQGLPQPARKYFKIATDAQSFCDLVCSSLSDSDDCHRDSAEIARLFGYPVIEEFIADLKTLS
jgi:polysaccharide biosynthesis protein PslH